MLTSIWSSIQGYIFFPLLRWLSFLSLQIRLSLTDLNQAAEWLQWKQTRVFGSINAGFQLWCYTVRRVLSNGNILLSGQTFWRVRAEGELMILMHSIFVSRAAVLCLFTHWCWLTGSHKGLTLPLAQTTRLRLQRKRPQNELQIFSWTLQADSTSVSLNLKLSAIKSLVVLPKALINDKWKGLFSCRAVLSRAFKCLRTLSCSTCSSISSLMLKQLKYICRFVGFCFDFTF